MKKLFHTLSALLSLYLSFQANPVLSQESLATDTLVAYYPFSGNAVDSSGFGNNGEVFGATLTRDRFGNENSAYEFDGIDDLINFGNDSSLNITRELTLSVWAKGSGPEEAVTALIGKTSFSFENGGGMAPYGIALDAGERLFTFIRNSEQVTGLLKDDLITNTSEWIHYASVFSPGEYLKLYKNGELIDSVVAEVSDSIGIEPERPLVAGARTNSSNTNLVYYFDGALDDIRVYSKALSDSVIQNLYNEKGWPETKYETPDTLVAYYPFSGNAADSSGFGNNGEVFGATLTRDRFGNENSAYQFDGDDYINTYSTFDYSSRSTSFWFELAPGTAESSEKHTLLIQDSNILENGAIAAEVINSKLTVFEGYGSSRIDYDGIVSSKWYHLVMVRDDSLARYYLDSELIGTAPSDSIGSSSNPEEHLIIGSLRSKDRNFVRGKIDDLRIYNYALSDSVIQDLYSEKGWPETKYEVPDTLVAYYPFSGNAGDSSGFGNDGEAFGSKLSRDRFGSENSAYEFDGQWDYVSLPHSEEFNVPYKTINFWFKRSGPRIDMNNLGTHGEGLAFKAFDTTINREFGIELFGAEEPFDLSFSVGSVSEQKNIAARIDSAVFADTWYQVTAVIDSSSIALYLDGIMVDSTMYTGTLFRNNAPVVLGKASSQSMQERYLEGMMDDIRIYNYVLSDSAIHNLYKEKGWPETKYEIPDTLVAYYPFSGNAEDFSGFDNDGEVFGATLTKDRFGNENSAYEFDGVDDLIDFGNDSSLNINEDLTISVWARGVETSNAITSLVGRSIFEPGEDGGGISPYGLGIDDGDRLYMFIRKGEEIRALEVQGLNINPDEWNHYIGVFKAGEYMKIFMNGTLIGSINDNIPSGIDDSVRPLYAGARSKSDNQSVAYYFKGGIDDIRIYNSALNDSSIQGLYTEKGWPGTKDTTLTSNEIRPDIPEEFKLYQNFPNPFNPSTVISYDLPEVGAVSLRIYDLTGRLVATLVEGNKAAGRYQVTLNAAILSSGVYFYELKTNKFSSVKKFTLIK